MRVMCSTVVGAHVHSRAGVKGEGLSSTGQGRKGACAAKSTSWFTR